MPSLVFNKGYKEYDVNGDKERVIRVYTSDWNIIQRIASLRERIAARVRSLQQLRDEDGFDEVMNRLNAVEREVRSEIDTAFGSPVSDAAFGEVNCLSFAGGQPIALNFLEAILPEIQKDLEAETEQAHQRISKYTDAAKRFD